MCQFLGKFLFFFQNSASKTRIFFPKLFQNPPVKWDHSKYCILNHQAEHAGTLPGGEQQQEPEPLWVLSRTFLILFTSHCTAQVLSCGESRYSLSSKAALYRVSCSFTKYNMAKQNLIHSLRATVHTWCTRAMVFLWRLSSLRFFSIFPVRHIFHFCL